MAHVARQLVLVIGILAARYDLQQGLARAAQLEREPAPASRYEQIAAISLQ